MRAPRPSLPAWWPAVLGVLLALNLIEALRHGTRWAWLIVAALALALAATLWRRMRPPPPQ